MILQSDEFKVSDKITKLIDILNKSYAKDNKIKTIIFVKDRSVAVYLQKLLAGDKNFQRNASGPSNEAQGPADENDDTVPVN